jgi:hypothetical protein
MLVGHALFGNRKNRFIGTRTPALGRFQNAFDIPFLPTEKAVSELTVSRQPQTIATRTERFRNWRDEADSANPILKKIVLGWLRGI